MSRTQLEDVYVKLEKIRAFDSLIDFSKSRIQLDIVLQLASARKPLSADDIARNIGQRKKPVLDALRKLELKGIIKRTEDHRNIYVLTDLGKQMIDDLATVLGASSLRDVVKSRMYGKVGARDLIKVIIPAYYLYEVLVALGTAKHHELPLNSLAKSVGISPQRLAVYLDPYAESRSEIRLFKKVRREGLTSKLWSLLFGHKKTVVYYRPTNLGLELYYRLPIYSKLKNSKAVSVLLRIFGFYNFRSLLLKLSLIEVALSTILMVTALLPLVGVPLLYRVMVGGVALFNAFLTLLFVVSHR